MVDRLPALPLPPSVRSRSVEVPNGLTFHLLEAGDPADPCLVLLHGFPELAFSWRSVMPDLARAGFYVIAPDQRGFGRTVGWDDRYDGDLASFAQLNLIADLLKLLNTLRVDRVFALIGHDFGSVVAAWAALIRPDVFASVVLMSAPFSGPPPLGAPSSSDALDRALAALSPPRRHYTHFFSLPEAAADLAGAPQGLALFLRGYFHIKSGDFLANAPFDLGPPSPAALSKLPTYYVMRRDQGMAETVARSISNAADIQPSHWLSEDDLAVYAAEFGRTGFQGGLNWYRALHDPALQIFAGRTIDIPSTFIFGERDWGAYQTPGALKAMSTRACTRFQGIETIPGAGHWVQQESPPAVVDAVLRFLHTLPQQRRERRGRPEGSIDKLLVVLNAVLWSKRRLCPANPTSAV